MASPRFRDRIKRYRSSRSRNRSQSSPSMRQRKMFGDCESLDEQEMEVVRRARATVMSHEAIEADGYDTHSCSEEDEPVAVLTMNERSRAKLIARRACGEDPAGACEYEENLENVPNKISPGTATSSICGYRLVPSRVQAHSKRSHSRSRSACRAPAPSAPSSDFEANNACWSGIVTLSSESSESSETESIPGIPNRMRRKKDAQSKPMQKGNAQSGANVKDSQATSKKNVSVTEDLNLNTPGNGTVSKSKSENASGLQSELVEEQEHCVASLVAACDTKLEFEAQSQKIECEAQSQKLSNGSTLDKSDKFSGDAEFIESSSESSSEEAAVLNPLPQGKKVVLTPRIPPPNRIDPGACHRLVVGSMGESLAHRQELLSLMTPSRRPWKRQ
eukprot:gnl/MRDRNA2_/MRDRNA2_106517_c0_seq1.p1 gnl/MRDRNA2_/MRDRNA2_106517_c0~~gnl/MRDRNA2_/MRDRNA2_106517_c0_seq1.p1  ORF type:complete len:420 (+),score=58.87 gnl/MRDRNA2_/MRDRNA2_106517_c0_seq1:92-1261(+)